VDGTCRICLYVDHGYELVILSSIDNMMIKESSQSSKARLFPTDVLSITLCSQRSETAVKESRKKADLKMQVSTHSVRNQRWLFRIPKISEHVNRATRDQLVRKRNEVLDMVYTIRHGSVGERNFDRTYTPPKIRSFTKGIQGLCRQMRFFSWFYHLRMEGRSAIINGGRSCSAASHSMGLFRFPRMEGIS
jgi:hypothetical protein